MAKTYYVVFDLKKAANQKAFQFPTTNTVEVAHVEGLWIRRTGKIENSGADISEGAVKNGRLVLKSAGVTYFDPLPTDIIASTNETAAVFYPIGMANLDWTGCHIKHDTNVEEHIELVIKFLK